MQESGFSQIGLYGVIFLIFYFLMIRPQQQKDKKMKEMLKNIKKNDEVVTSSGIHGTIAIVKDTTVVVRVDEGCRIEFDREAISSVKTVTPEIVK
jgi:preprotein translocase subunit YajC